MTSLALLVLRATVGSLLAGHGGQKLFGWFGGRGFTATTSWMESMGLRPGHRWAGLAGLSEFGGGVLTALGFLSPVGPLMSMGAMLMATFKAHAGKPIWGTAGGAELPLTNIAVQTALVATGPGAISLDRLLGIRLPRWVSIVGLGAVVAGVWYGLRQSQPGTVALADDAAEAEFVAEVDHLAELDAGIGEDDLHAELEVEGPAIAAMRRELP
ncbi:MAG TPA: DoxX family protein [Candidatus Limnocylindrales bacterium]|nr:DoxX family protein [Candidatus Limnocylindrales bacterium]